MDYKVENRRTYDQYAEAFDEKFERHFQDYVRSRADDFLEQLNGRRILDLGSGPGNHARYFRDRGYDVLCADLSEEMVGCCRAKGLAAERHDIESLRLPAESFDGIWAYASLLHVPKTKISAVVDGLERLLVPRGLLFLAVKEGDGESWEANENYPGTLRRFSYFSDAEIRALFLPRFELLAADRSSVKSGAYHFLYFLFRLREA